MNQVKTMTSEEEIDFHLIKSRLFRNIAFDGAFGAISPHRKIHLTLFTERPAIPKKLVFDIGSDDSIGDEIVEKREGKEGITRDLEANLVFDYETAEMLRDLLDLIIEEGVAEETSVQKGDQDER